VLEVLGIGVLELVITEYTTSENLGTLKVLSYLSLEIEITLSILDRVGERLEGASAIGALPRPRPFLRGGIISSASELDRHYTDGKTIAS
jgi:hypothetical protein